LPSGSYQAIVTVRSNDVVVGGASAGFQVVDGRITALTAPDVLVPGQEANFQVTFANYRAGQVTAEVGLSIYDGQGLPVADLPPQAMPVGPGSEETVGFAWDSAGAGGGSYTAIATVTAGGQPYGPAQEGFRIAGKVYLPLVVKSYG